MKVCIQQFLSSNHSWSITGQNIARALIKFGYQVDLFSTNGNKHFPDDLKSNLIGYGENNKIISGQLPGNDYDMTISYTAMRNFSRYLQHSKKNRFGIYCYEFAGKNSLPNGFAKNHLYCDKILAPSYFARKIFLESGVPEDKVIVIPHGINIDEINLATARPLKTKKKVKILINLGQVHKRKNLTGALETFGKAFDQKSDVCLIIKVQDKIPSQRFELSFTEIFRKFQEKYPQHAEVEIIKEFIPNIYSLYKSCDITFSPSHCEGFGLVPLEGLACGLIPVASRYGGFLDFLNDNNSFLIDGKEFNVPPDYLYYQNKLGTKAFMPNIDHSISQLRAAACAVLDNKLFNFNIQDHSWDNVCKKIINLTK